MTANLREIKRQATLDAIEESATRLVEERGYEDVTIEEICEQAQISRRTFFNYVDSKETAVLGALPQPISDEQLREFAQQPHDDLLIATLELCFLVVPESHLSASAATGLVLRRKAIRRAHPELAYARFSAFSDIYQQVVEAVVDHFARFPNARKLPDASAAKEARAIVSIATQSLQLGYWNWHQVSDSSQKSLSQHSYESLHLMRDLLRSPHKNTN